MIPRKFYTVSLICLLSLPLLGTDSVPIAKADAVEDWQAKPVIMENTEITGSVPVYTVKTLESKFSKVNFEECLLEEIEGVYKVKDSLCIADTLSPVGVPYATEYKFYAEVSEEEFDLSSYWVLSWVDESSFSHGYARDLRDEYEGQNGRPFYFVFTQRGQLKYTFYFSIDSSLKRLDEIRYNKVREVMYSLFGFYIDSYEAFVKNLAKG